MGQKINPHGLRVGVIKDWESKWFPTEDCDRNYDSETSKRVVRNSGLHKSNG